MNTGEPEKTFPIKSLHNEIELNSGNKYGKVTANRSKGLAATEAYISSTIQIEDHSCVHHSVPYNEQARMQHLNQFYPAMNDYELAHNSSAALCDAVAAFKPNQTLELEPAECVVVSWKML
ncbi:hypothetical protein YQE_02623, partial [Dendroctonus ponderosae]